jgi:hypothetical protein
VICTSYEPVPGKLVLLQNCRHLVFEMCIRKVWRILSVSLLTSDIPVISEDKAYERSESGRLRPSLADDILMYVSQRDSEIWCTREMFT